MKKAYVILNKLTRYILPAITFIKHDLDTSPSALKIFFSKAKYRISMNEKQQFLYEGKKRVNLKEDEILKLLKKREY